MGVGPSSRETQPRTLIRSRFPDAWMRRAAVGRFPKAEVGVRAACARLRVSTFRALRVPAFTRAESRGGGRRPDHGATTGRVILPVRGVGRGWRRGSGTTWKWLDMTEEEITEIPNTTPVPIFFHQSTDVEARNPGLKQGPSRISVTLTRPHVSTLAPAPSGGCAHCWVAGTLRDDCEQPRYNGVDEGKS